MDNFNNGQKARVADAASDLVNESKKWANEVYEDSMHKVTQVEDELIVKIQQNPLASVLIAGGIGFVLAKIMCK